MKRLLCSLTASLALAWGVSPVFAQVPQTIVVDGVNDFNPANLIDADGGDTEIKDWCTGDGGAVEGPMDLGDIYVTNDSNFLYVGYEYDKYCFASPAVNLGMAIDVNGPLGGTSDAFNRKIAWNTVVNKPDFYLYDVFDGFNYEVLYNWTGASWSVVADGSNGLGIVEGTGFIEYKLSLATLGVAAGDTVRVEFWMTQDGTTKPPLDACFSDGVQTSTPAGTVFDVNGAPIEMSGYHPYVVQSNVDVTPPAVESAKAVGFTVTGGVIATTTNKVDVKFSEPVGAGATAIGNYSVSNFGGIVVGASVDGSDNSLVHLTLSSPIGASANFYNVTVQNVQDLAGNPIVNNGTDNVKSFFIKRLRFEGDMSVFLLTNSAPPDSFWIEGSLSPLTFTPKDNARMTDVAGDSVFVTQVPLSVSKNTGTGKAEALLEWKFFHRTAGYEPRSNRQHTVSSDNGAADTLRFFWNDFDPTQVTDKEIDVIFRVDMSSVAPGPTDTVSVTGSETILNNFGIPGVLMADDGVFPDDVAGDDIYAKTVRFPVGTNKNVNYKFTFNSDLECFGQGDRSVFLNDAEFDIVGGTNGPIDLPARGYDRCTVIDKDVAVVFRVDVDYFFGGAITSVGLDGSVDPLNFNVPSITPMADNGLSPDAVALDDTFTVVVVFPDSSNQYVEYKYLINDEFECPGLSNRGFNIDDVNSSVASPQVLPVGIWNYCSDIVTGIGDGDGRVPTPRVTIHLAQNYPNPFATRTSIEFRAERSGRAVMQIFDVAGRLVATPLDRDVTEGLQVVQWNGVDQRGRSVTPGIYFYTVTLGGEKETRRMVLTK